MDTKGNINRIVGILVKDLRLKQNLSQEKLALESGTDRTYISLLERGLRTPSIYSLFLLCKKLQISLKDFTAQLEQQLNK